MLFETFGDKSNPAVLFFHAMGVTGASSEPVARQLQDRYYCILPTSTVYCAGQKYAGKADEVQQEDHFKYRSAVMRAYPAAHFPVWEGYDHMQYQIRDPQGFAALLRSLMEQDALPPLPPLHIL